MVSVTIVEPASLTSKDNGNGSVGFTVDAGDENYYTVTSNADVILMNKDNTNGKQQYCINTKGYSIKNNEQLPLTPSLTEITIDFD
jgi:hypothetical protein